MIGGPLHEIPTRVARKQATPKGDRHRDSTRTGFRVESVGEGDYFGWTLDGDGRFLLGDFTVTHNTTWAATFPRPLFFSDISEHGYEALMEENWNSELFEPDVLPIVWGINKQSDMAECIEKAKPLIASGRVRTIVIDSISFYADLYLNMILMAQEKTDMRQGYGKLGIHLRNARITVHDLNVNVVWLALAKHPDHDEQGKLKFKGRPMIPGEQADKFMAGVDFTFHFRFEKPQPTQPGRFEMRTKEYASYIAGNRLGKRAQLLPDPMIGTYSSMMAALGYDPTAIRDGLPDLSKVPVIKQVAAGSAAKPPISAAKPKVTIKTVGN
jgi:hypothetical protein